jgi:ribose/xylose/arabinose/galactoside ABC-type transport system permease subunit
LQQRVGLYIELDAIAAVVGVLLLGVIFNLFNLEGTISPWWQLVLCGLILLLSVIIQNRLDRRK